MSEDMVVLDHHLSKAEEVYRLTVGYAVEHKVPVFDDNGDPAYEDVVATDESGEPLKRLKPKSPKRGADPKYGAQGDEEDGFEEDGHQYTREQLFDVVTEIIPVEDFVFAADDKKWEGLSDEEIAKRQRTIVKQQLTKRRNEQEKAVKKAARSRKSMPGAMEAL